MSNIFLNCFLVFKPKGYRSAKYENTIYSYSKICNTLFIMWNKRDKIMEQAAIRIQTLIRDRVTVLPRIFWKFALLLPSNIAATSVALLSKITELRDRFVSILSTPGTWDRYFIMVNLRLSALMGGDQRDNRGILIIRGTHLVKINERRNGRRHAE